ncbi:MAG: histidine kinase [Clostridiales bacterium]|nr:histidine kinase [Clostridiales bacterium]
MKQNLSEQSNHSEQLDETEPMNASNPSDDSEQGKKTSSPYSSRNHPLLASLYCKWNQIPFLARLLTSLFTCLLILLILITFTTQFTTRHTLRENAIQNGLDSIENRATLLEVNLAQIERLANNLYSNADVYNLIQSNSIDAQSSYRISLFLRSMMAMSSGLRLHQIYLDIYTSGYSYIISENRNSSFGTSFNHINIPDYIIPGEVFCEGPHLSNNYGYSIGESSAMVYTFHWKLYDTSQTHTIGTLSFDVALDAMSPIVFPNENDIGFLMQRSDMVFTHELQLTDQQAKDILSRCVNSEHWSPIKMDEFTGIALYQDVQLSNLTLHLVELIPYSRLYAEANHLFVLNLILIAAAFILGALFIALVTRQIIRPIRQMDECMYVIESNGDLNYRLGEHIPYSASDEVGNLIHRTDRMLDTVETLFHRQELLSKAQRDAEARMLQAQINPHFLYNSLQSLAGLALSHGDREVFDYITLLGSQMHYSMDIQHTTATLHQEFDYVEGYLALQNLRFGNGMRADFSLSPEAEHLAVPRMILQPLAENAFKHGKLCRTADTFLRLSAWMEEGVLHIIMENNGLPIPEDQLTELNEKFSVPGIPDTALSEHIGMPSVLYRLRLFFNDDVTMKVDSPAAMGEGDAAVRVSVRIPLG